MRSYLALALLSFVAASAAHAGEVYKWTDDKGVVHYTETPPPGRDFEKKKVAASKPATPAPATATQPGGAAAPAPAQGSTEANCIAARRNVENLERFDEISMDRDGDGKPEKLTPEQKDEEIKRSQALANLYCPQEAAPSGQ
jgi:hypothetical protein